MGGSVQVRWQQPSYKGFWKERASRNSIWGLDGYYGCFGLHARYLRLAVFQGPPPGTIGAEVPLQAFNGVYLGAFKA